MSIDGRVEAALSVANGSAPWPDSRGALDREALDELAETRTVVRRVLAAALAGAPLASADVAAVNTWAAAVPEFPQIDRDGRVRVATRRLSPSAVARGAVARAVIELLGSHARARLATCRAPGCGRYHLRGRPDQVWCSPACGNRARVARHHARRRARARS